MIEFQSPGVVAPDRSIVAVILENSEIGAPGVTRLRFEDPVPDRPGNFIIDFPLARADAVTRTLAISRMISLRRAGATFVLITYDESLMEQCADEVWWIRDGKLLERGDPGQVLPLYRDHVSKEVRKSGEGERAVIAPTLRTGDGRAHLDSIELIANGGTPSTVFTSGDPMTIRVTVKYISRVEDPVIGILVRTRIGLNVYGTNTELEQLRPGPVKAGDTLRISYSFRCDLCPGDYTVTAASHDPDGVWHDWLEDAVAFAVTDTRYTAGVANLRAEAAVERVQP